jgi:hypothetical protein
MYPTTDAGPKTVDPEVPEPDQPSPAVPEEPEVPGSTTHPTRLPEDPR